MRYIRYKIEKQQINFLNCNDIDEWIDTCHTRETEFIDVCLGDCECGSTIGSGSTSGDTSGNTSGSTMRTTVRGNGSESVVLRYSGTSKEFDKLLIDGVSVDTRTTTYVFNDNEIHTVDYYGVQDIGHFFDNSDVITVVIPSSVTTINGTFWGCNSLTSVFIPNSVTTIGYDAFNFCQSLTSFTIPDSVTEIGAAAFFRCSGLTSVTIGSGLTSIGDRGFYFCEKLNSITCYATIAPSLGFTDVLYGLPTNGKLYVPQGSDYSSWLSELPNGWTIEYL